MTLPCRPHLPVLLLFLAVPTAGLLAEPYKSEPGPFQVQIELGSWIDAGRDDREVPWRLYAPQNPPGAVPVVLWSHGAGGSRDGAEYLGRHLASHGYAAFHLQHPGTDRALLEELGVRGMLEAIGERPEATRQRFADIGFAVDQVRAMQASGPWAGRFDVARMGISGHSFGAITALVAAGQKFPGVGHAYAVPSLRGAFAMSPSPPRRGSPEAAFDDMLMPIFHLTGTADESPLGDFEPGMRQLPFRYIDDVDQYLLVLTDAVHMTFSGRDAGYEELARHHQLIRMAAVAFWDLLLRDDERARAWLEEGGMARELGDDGFYELERAAQ